MYSDQFGETLRGRRTALGLTRRALAERAGLDAGFVRDVERGTNLATLRKLARLCAALSREESQQVVGTISQNTRKHVKNR